MDFYTGLKYVFLERLALACKVFGNSFLSEQFSTFSTNIIIRDGVNYTSTSSHIHGLLDYAVTSETYKLKGYTFLPVLFGRTPTAGLNRDLEQKMPNIMVEDSMGFISCLQKNVNKITETVDGQEFNIGSAGDYALSSKLAMTIVKAQGISLDRVAICFGNHNNIKLSHVYVAISRAVDPKYVVMDNNPLKKLTRDSQQSEYILKALSNPATLLVY